MLKSGALPALHHRETEKLKILTTLALLMLFTCWPVVASEPLRLAVAANFRVTADSINAAFTAQTGHKILLSSGSTGTLASQLLHGAPFDLFLAADQETPARLVKSGTGLMSQCYAVGNLVLVGGDLNDLAEPDLSLAIGNPATAPYGKAAMEVLARPEFTQEKTIVRGTNVLQAYQFWLAGATDMALVARALAPDATPVPGHWHRPLEQHFVVLRDSPVVSTYLRWLQSDTVRQIITNAGYRPCP